MNLNRKNIKFPNQNGIVRKDFKKIEEILHKFSIVRTSIRILKIIGTGVRRMAI